MLFQIERYIKSAHSVQGQVGVWLMRSLLCMQTTGQKILSLDRFYTEEMSILHFPLIQYILHSQV